jgi:hypothetical protein
MNVQSNSSHKSIVYPFEQSILGLLPPHISIPTFIFWLLWLLFWLPYSSPDGGFGNHLHFIPLNSIQAQAAPA